MTEWSTRAIIAETRAESLGRKQEDLNNLVSELRGEVFNLQELLASQKKLLTKTQNALLALYGLVIKFNIKKAKQKKDKLSIAPLLKKQIGLLKEPILKEKAHRKALRLRRKLARLGVTTVPNNLEHPDVLNVE